MTTQFTPVENASSFRRMAAAMWRSPRDPSIYGSMDVDATAALAYLASLPKQPRVWRQPEAVATVERAAASDAHRLEEPVRRIWQVDAR